MQPVVWCSVVYCILQCMSALYNTVCSSVMYITVYVIIIYYSVCQHYILQCIVVYITLQCMSAVNASEHKSAVYMSSVHKCSWYIVHYKLYSISTGMEKKRASQTILP